MPRSKGWGAECLVCKIPKGNNLGEGGKGLCLFFFLIVFVILTFSVFIMGRSGGVFLKMLFLSQKDSSPLPFKKIFK